MLTYKQVHSSFAFNSTHYAFNELNSLSEKLLAKKEAYLYEIGSFLQLWQDSNSTIVLKTSGSTGIPKKITVKKQAMINSAIATGLFFNLHANNKALLCLPAHYIAGKMMLVRAMVLGLDLEAIEPKSTLNINTEKHYNFSAMVPMQVENNLDKLHGFKTIIIGGAKVSQALNKKLQNLMPTFFETYGMTETVSHIAVKQLNNLDTKKSEFKTLPEVSIAQDDRDCLIIKAPKVSDDMIVTNDVVELISNTEFKWLGRADNIINSGGIKVFPEQIENTLSSKIEQRFFIASEPDKKFGERVILVVEGEENTLDTSVFKDIESYKKPKKVYYISKFVETNSGKIQRQKTLQRLKK